MTYQFQNFVSDIGGLAGLFLGLSLLTMFELTLKVLHLFKGCVLNLIIMAKRIKNRITARRRTTQLPMYRNDRTYIDLSVIDIINSKFEKNFLHQSVVNF